MRVGILMMMLPDSEMYVRDQVCSWLESAGLELVFIPPTITGTEAAALFDYIHGLFIHPGEVGKSVDIRLTQMTHVFLTMALEAAKKGDYFPVWGTCHGMQQILQYMGGIHTLETFTSKDYYTTLHFRGPSRLLQFASTEESNQLRGHYTPFFNHEHGISLNTFQKSTKLKAFNVVATAVDRNNRTYLAIIEGKTLPWYGTQFHPEYKMDWMAAFFASELKKSRHTGFNPHIIPKR
jgi:gamma-glutamyl hydrolase